MKLITVCKIDTFKKTYEIHRLTTLFISKIAIIMPILNNLIINAKFIKRLSFPHYSEPLHISNNVFPSRSM